MRSPGFHSGVPEADYHADRESLSVSGAKVLLKAPALFRWQQDNPVHKDVFDFGSAAHERVLGIGPELVVFEYDAKAIKSPKSTSAWKEMQREVRATGGILLLPAEKATVDAMALKLKEHRLAMRLLSQGQAEVSAYALDESSNVTMRGRFDWLNQNIVIDYKSCVSANPADWAGRYGVIAKFGYDMQAEWYLDLARRLGHPAQAFAWIAQEKEPPFLTTVIYADEADLINAGERNALARSTFAECMETGHWPGYVADDEYAEVSLGSPSWQAVVA